MLHRAEQAGRGGSREPERGERESEGDVGVPTVDVGDPAARPRVTRGWSQDARQTGGDPQCRLTPWSPGGDRIFRPDQNGALMGQAGFCCERPLAMHRGLSPTLLPALQPPLPSCVYLLTRGGGPWGNWEGSRNLPNFTSSQAGRRSMWGFICRDIPALQRVKYSMKF